MRFEKINSVSIIIPVAESYQDAIELARSDFYRSRGKNKKGSIINMLFYTFKEPAFAFMFWHRMSSYKCKSLFYYFSKLMHRHFMFKYGILIPSSTKIGYGLSIGHPLSIVVNHTTIIGNNCNLSHCVTIGANERNAAVIGDNVYIGPHVAIVEDRIIHSNSTIGAGTIVVNDIPENATVVGNPLRVVSFNNPGRYINNRWPKISFSL